MSDTADASTEKPVSRLKYLLRISWIVVQLVLVYSLSGEFQPFFYQAF